MIICDAKTLVYPRMKEVKPGWWELVEDYIITVGEDVIEVPKGFQCDLASIPSGLQFYYGTPGSSQNEAAGLCHDWLYTVQYCFDKQHEKYAVSRKEADDILYNILVMFGHSKFSAYKMWIAVRICGGSHWKSLSAKYIAQMKSMGETQ